MKADMISADFNFQSQYIDVLGSNMHYIEQGTGDPILFLHGMPTSCYLWRNIIPHLSSLGRCIAVDLIGMGKSDKPAIEYTVEDHIKYISKFIETLNLKNITVVMHGWGSIVGLELAMLRESNFRGLVLYEAYLRAINNEDISLPFQEQISILDGEENTYDLMMNGIQFVDHALLQGVTRLLSEDEMARYREPFLQSGSGRPLKQYLHELPRDTGDNRINNLISGYSSKLIQSKLPKLLLYSLPGFTTTIATVLWAKENIPNLEVAEVGEALHYAQESNPVLMGETISIWLQAL
jgi:haloalkane dehalogenase